MPGRIELLVKNPMKGNILILFEFFGFFQKSFWFSPFVQDKISKLSSVLIRSGWRVIRIKTKMLLLFQSASKVRTVK